MSSSGNSVSCNFGMGSMIAAVISAILNHSFWWAILHFFCGFFYVIYALAFRSHELVVAFRTMFS